MEHSKIQHAECREVKLNSRFVVDASDSNILLFTLILCYCAYINRTTHGISTGDEPVGLFTLDDDW